MKAKLIVLAAAAMLVAIPATAQAIDPPVMTLGGAKLNKKKGTATVAATVNQAGGLTLRDPNAKAVKQVHLDVTAAGTYVLKVKPTKSTKRKLNKDGKAKVKVAVTYIIPKAPNVYTSGEIVQSKTITLKKK